jgi:nucleotide-binding universal stress UspA family protein
MYPLILVPLDGSPIGDAGLAEALALARRLGSSIRVLHVVDPRPLIGSHASGAARACFLEQGRDAGRDLVMQAARRAQAMDVAAEPVVLCQPERAVSAVIVEDAVASGAGLIVMGCRGRPGVRPHTFGSDAAEVLDAAPVPVLLVRAREA